MSLAPADLFDLAGKTAVVIGGTGELCGAMAEGLAAAGGKLVLVGRDAAKAEKRMDAITAGGGQVSFEACEVSSRSALEDLARRISNGHGKIDILVNGAGVNSATPFLDISDEEMDRIITINLKAVLVACQVFGKLMVASGGGSIINLGSMSGVVPLSRVFTYSATKAAVHNLSKNLARELIGATLLLASDAGSFITGTELVVDGGFASMTI